VNRQLAVTEVEPGQTIDVWPGDVLILEDGSVTEVKQLGLISTDGVAHRIPWSTVNDFRRAIRRHIPWDTLLEFLEGEPGDEPDKQQLADLYLFLTAVQAGLHFAPITERTRTAFYRAMGVINDGYHPALFQIMFGKDFSEEEVA
jgi:hypothetical protein